MDSASYPPRTGYQPGSPRERLVSTVLSLGIILIVVLAMIFQAIVPPQRRNETRPVSFNIDGPDTNKAARKSQSRPKAPHVATRALKPSAAPVKPVITVQKQVERPDAEDGIPGFIHMSSADLAAADIGKMKGSAKGSDSDGKGNDSDTAYGPGEGPGGVRLYNADWYRHPTDAELSTYMPKNGGIEGWGLVACQTIEHYHVDNCMILGESPRGSGFGRAVQNAAWQFLVKPPRIDNQPQVGKWVRIRIDYSVKKTRGQDPSSEDGEGQG
jgi:protein TonB